MLTPQTMDTSPEGRAFLQHRVASFCGLVAALGGLFLVFRVISTLAAGGGLEWLLHGAMTSHLWAVVVLAVAWLSLRRPEASLARVLWTEFVALSLSCACYAWMGTYIPLVYRPEMVVLSALNVSLVARAVFVPSTGRRTFSLTAASYVPLVAGTWWMYTEHAFEVSSRTLYDAGDIPELMLQLGPTHALQVSIEMAMWSLVSTVLATVTSRVIYGLRQQAKDARRLGQYTLEAKIGEGGMGIVYRARHAMLRRPTAVKLLPPAKAGEKTIARFEREVQLTARLTHPNTVTVFDYGRTPDGLFYYAMELLHGATLEQVVALDGAQSAARVVHVLTQVAGALEEAHGIGLIHRDIKPANIMLGQRGGLYDVAKVLDFGLVKDLEQEGDVGLSSAHVLTGTPLYLSPEAIVAPERVGPRSDLYSLGCVGYFLLTGEHVFTGSSVVEVCGHHLHSQPEPPSRRLDRPVPASLEEIVLTCLAKEPGDRFESAGALRQALETIGGGWSSDDAARWWREHAGDLPVVAETSQESRTLAVDVIGRG